MISSSVIAPVISSADESSEEKTTEPKPVCWKVLVVDDEKEIHKLTEMVLDDVVFQGRRIELLSAFSASEAMVVINENPDTALVILDVVMETDDAGLRFVRYIRKILENRIVQIVLRTGQPGLAPPQKVIEEYDINSYSSKIELTAQRIYTLVIASLRAYDLAFSLQQANIKLQEEVEQRISAEKEIRKLNRFQEIVIENASIWLDVADEKDRIVVWNKAAEKISGYTMAEMYDQQTCYRRLYPNKAYRRSVIEQIADAQSSQEVETIIKCRDGSSRNIVWSIYKLFDETVGAEIGTISLGRDITEHKQMENQLLQTGKMEAVGRMAGGVAHDFNNILTVIRGHCELLLVRLSPNDPFIEKIEQIDSAAARAGKLTRQLLAFSRHRVSKPSVVNVNTLISEMIDMLGRMAGDKMRIITRLQRGIKNIQADSSQIEQTVMNLVVNAVDAMNGTGRILITTQSADQPPVKCQDVKPCDNGFVLIRVRDFGEGIPPGIVDKIFEPFFTTKPKGKGTGLGLSIVYGAVHRNEGDVMVETFPEKGTEFTICFPATEEGLALEGTTGLRTPPFQGKETILVVDDQPEVLALTAETLSFYGYEVLTSASGEKALELFEEENTGIDLVLTDIEMDAISGVQLASILKKKYPDLKIIFMSGYADDINEYDEIIEPGENFIEKPFSAKKLLKIIQAVFKQ
jgi:PAS domain S-box-containing protein